MQAQANVNSLSGSVYARLKGFECKGPCSQCLGHVSSGRDWKVGRCDFPEEKKKGRDKAIMGLSPKKFISVTIFLHIVASLSAAPNPLSAELVSTSLTHYNIFNLIFLLSKHF